ncbi:hypothetical protein F5Y16DRAFT_406827 [Xylariaceae sp. FL0255]|nr:hypothetical protein F5Y16DRAFT_406827 [Xylariaceae sp. FL0255]
MSNSFASITSGWSFYFVKRGVRPPPTILFHVVGPTADFRYDQLAIWNIPEQWRRTNCYEPTEPWGKSVVQPPEWLIGVQGILQAWKMRRMAFRRTILNGIELYDKPLCDLYRSHPAYGVCRLFIEWSILLRDSCSSAIQDRFVQFLLQICASLDENAQSEMADLTVPDVMESWRQTIQLLDKSDIPNSSKESDCLHQLALLRRVFEAAGGREDTFQRFNFYLEGRTVDKNIHAIGMSIDIEGTLAHKSLDPQRVCRFLNRCEVFRKEPMTEEVLQERACILYGNGLMASS